jgi:hypothetical protein
MTDTGAFRCVFRGRRPEQPQFHQNQTAEMVMVEIPSISQGLEKHGGLEHIQPGSETATECSGISSVSEQFYFDGSSCSSSFTYLQPQELLYGKGDMIPDKSQLVTGIITEAETRVRDDSTPAMDSPASTLSSSSLRDSNIIDDPYYTKSQSFQQWGTEIAPVSIDYPPELLLAYNTSDLTDGALESLGCDLQDQGLCMWGIPPRSIVSAPLDRSMTLEYEVKYAPPSFLL